MNDTEDDTGDLEPAPKRGGLLAVFVLAGIVLMVACAGGGFMGYRWYLQNAAFVLPDVTELDAEPVAGAAPSEPAADGSILPDLSGVSPADPEDGAPVAAATPEPVAPAVVVDRGSENLDARDHPSHSTTSAAPSTGSSQPRSSGTASSSYSNSGSHTNKTTGSGTTTTRYVPSKRVEPIATESVAMVDDVGPTGSEDSDLQLDRYADAAAYGTLTSSDVMVLEMVQPSDTSYNRSRMLLVMNAKVKKDDGAVKRYLDELMLRPENQYNPIILVEYARHYVNTGDYQRAMEKATLAERHWARIPPELIFIKKAEIYEIQAASYQGLFYQSEDNLELLAKAIRGWQRYRDHVKTKSRADLQAKADGEIEKLENIESRLR